MCFLSKVPKSRLQVCAALQIRFLVRSFNLSWVLDFPPSLSDLRRNILDAQGGSSCFRRSFGIKDMSSWHRRAKPDTSEHLVENRMSSTSHSDYRISPVFRAYRVTQGLDSKSS